MLKEGGNKCKGWAPQLQSQGFEVREVTGHGGMVDTNLTMTKLSASVVNWPTPVSLEEPRCFLGELCHTTRSS